MFLSIALCLCTATQETLNLPRVELTGDDQVIASSCRLVLPDGPIADAGQPGVVLIRGDDLHVICEGVLTGAADSTAPETMSGVGISIQGDRVRVDGGSVRGFRVGLEVLNSKHVTLAGWDLSDNFRSRLHSTPQREDLRDWLQPHENRTDQWVTRYGAGIHAKECDYITIEKCRARRTQNGVIFDLVGSSAVRNCDFSYLSGWGVALWRSYENTISESRLDFCVRGYSHGVYNRGQDSAGVLIFEQCHRNEVSLNSITHCGDGVFAHAGSIALGVLPPPRPDYRYRSRGNRHNVFYRNDLSFAAAHGLETTFTRGDRIVQNLVEGNAITGLWGGYSKELEIKGNRFLSNGDAGYGSERGAINIEHGRHNTIATNKFIGNTLGIRLWWDEDPDLAALPWTELNGDSSEENEIFGNSFRGEPIAIELSQAGTIHIRENRFKNVEQEIVRDKLSPDWISPTPTVARISSVAAKERGVRVRGREHIVMGVYGPWDGVSVELQQLDHSSWRLLATQEQLDGWRESQPDIRIDWSDGQATRAQLSDDGAFRVEHQSGEPATSTEAAYSILVTVRGQRELRATGVAQLEPR